MYIMINYEAVFQSVKDTWVPIIIPFGILILIFILIASFRREKDVDIKEIKKIKNERKKK